MNFGQALEELKNGERIARSGWNGKNMFLFLLPEGEIPISAIYCPILRQVIKERCNGDTFKALPSIRMWTATGEVLTGWLASQTDMFANDWYVVTD